MDLISTVIFVVGLAVGGGGILLFKRKSTVTHASQLSVPITSHTNGFTELDKLTKELNDLKSKNKLEKDNLENEISQLKRQEGILKDQLSNISSNQNLSKERAELHSSKERIQNEIKAKDNEILSLKQIIQNQEIENSKIEQEAQKFIDDLANKHNEEIDSLKKSLSIELGSQTPITSVKPINTRKILVVDDSKVVRNKLNSTLKKAGYNVELAEDGQDALNKLSTMKDFDLIITDLEMPNVDGHQLITAVYSDTSIKHIPMVAITGHEDITISVAHSEGLVGVHKKPWKDDELLRKLEVLSGLR